MADRKEQHLTMESVIQLTATRIGYGVDADTLSFPLAMTCEQVHLATVAATLLDKYRNED